MTYRPLDRSTGRLGIPHGPSTTAHSSTGGRSDRRGQRTIRAPGAWGLLIDWAASVGPSSPMSRRLGRCLANLVGWCALSSLIGGTAGSEHEEAMPSTVPCAIVRRTPCTKPLRTTVSVNGSTLASLHSRPGGNSMGIWNRIFGDNNAESSSRVRSQPHGSEAAPVISRPEKALVQLAGTTTFGRKGMAEVLSRRGVGSGGYLELTGSLYREPGNSADPLAVAVYAEEQKIAYLPGPVAREADGSWVDGVGAPVQIFVQETSTGLRAEAWAWLGGGAPQWKWSRHSRPPMTAEEKSLSRHESANYMVVDALSGGGARADDFKAGMIRGVHYLQLVEPIKQLKRESRLEEALTLCYAAISGAEESAKRDGTEPAPWYTIQAAIIHRKLKEAEKEAAVLNRWLEKCPPGRRDNSSVAERLDKLNSRRPDK